MRHAALDCVNAPEVVAVEQDTAAATSHDTGDQTARPLDPDMLNMPHRPGSSRNHNSCSRIGLVDKHFSSPRCVTNQSRAAPTAIANPSPVYAAK